MPQGAPKKKKQKLSGVVKAKNKPKEVQTARKNKPVTPKKARYEEVQKLKKIITKNVNRNMEEQIRAVATDGQKVRLSSKKNKETGGVDPNKMPPTST